MNVNEWDKQPCRHSQCEVCEYYFKSHSCWMHDYIMVDIWNCPSRNCKHFKSVILHNDNSNYVFQDYESFPEDKKYGGKYRFDSKGNIIGER